MGEVVEASGPGVHLQQRFGQVHDGDAGVDVVAQLGQGVWFIEPVQAGEHEMIAAVAVLDAHRRVVGQAVGELSVGAIEAGGPAVEVDTGSRVQPEVAAHLGAGFLPCGAVEQPGGWVAPLVQAGHEDLVAAQALAQQFGGGDGVGALVELAGLVALGGEHAAVPGSRQERSGHLAWGDPAAAFLDGAQELQRG